MDSNTGFMVDTEVNRRDCHMDSDTISRDVAVTVGKQDSTRNLL